MLGVTSGSKLIWNRSDWTVRKGNDVWIWIQLPFNENRIKISVKNSNLDLPWNYQKLCEYQSWSLKKTKNLHLNSEFLSKLNIRRLALSNTFKKRKRNNLYWKLASPTLTNVKSICSYLDNFSWPFFLAADISHKLVAPF